MSRDEIRRRAEAALSGDQPVDKAELARLVHELRVYELELATQNEELRESELALRHARDQYFELFDLAPVAYLMVTADGKIAAANIVAAQLLGCDRGELMHTVMSAFVHPRDVDLFWLYLRDLFASGEHRGMEMRLGRCDPATPVRLEGVAVPGTGKTPTCARLAVIDLSELRSANERSRLHLLRYKQLVQTLPVGVLVIDRDWRLVDVNDAAAEALRTNVEELRGAHLRAVMPESASPRWLEAVSRVFRQGEAVAVTDSHTFADGVTRWYELRAFPVNEGVCGLLSDISARQGAQAALADSEARFRAVVTAARDAIITVDVHGKIESFNPAAERLFGYTTAQALGTSIACLVPAEQPAGDDGIIADLAAGDTTLTGEGRELEGRRADGEAFPIHMVMTRVEVAGEPKFVSYIRDLTEPKRLERELRQAQKMEAIGTLASGVAHDFNNLLMGVSGCASIALDHLEDSSPARLYVAEIKKSVDSGAAITRQLLTFSRKREDRPAVFELNRLVAGQQAMLQRLLGEDVELSIQPRASDSRVRMAPSHVEQMLMNLAINARDAMPEGGKLTLATRDLDDADKFALSVSDSGIGMIAEQAERVFEPFFTTKPEGEGSGLGLSTVYNLVTHAGGTISVTSQPGAGTRFDIVLPRARAEVTKELEPVVVEAEQHDETILLVEDDHTVRMAIKHYLEGAGFRVLEASTGVEATECAEKFSGPIHLLLSDVTLPMGSGRQVAEAVRLRKPNASVLYISAHSAERLQQRGEVEPGALVVQKPFRRDELLARVYSALRSDPSRLP